MHQSLLPIAGKDGQIQRVNALSEIYALNCQTQFSLSFGYGFQKC